MADPFAIIQSGMLDIGKINSDYNLNRYRGLEAKVYAHKAAQEDATAAREAAARAAIGRGAKPDEVMAQDLDMGTKYADYVKNNGDQAHETAQRQAGAIVQIGTALKSVPRGPQRQGVWARALPVLKSVGVTDADLANFDPNDDNAIDAQVISHKALLKAGEDYTLGHARYSGATNAVIAREAEDPKWQEFDPTHTYVPLNGAASTFGHGSGGLNIPGTDPAGGRFTPGIAQSGDGGFHSIVAAEGGTNPDGSFRTSPKGAIGPAQLMPGTIPEAAQLAGVDPNLVASDPRANLAAGEAYYNKQLSDFGDPALAAAAYNAGPGRVRDALQRGGPQGWIQHVPAETQAYVQKVIGGRSGGSAEGGATVGGAASFPPGTIIGHPKATEDTVLTPEAIDYYAHSLAAGGDLPTLGQGPRAAKARQDILNRAAQFGAAGGDDGSGRNLSRADLKANASALAAITKQASFIASAERTALANGQIYLDTAKTAPGQTGIPLLNKGLQWVEGGAGNPEVKAMHAAGETFALEYAKVMSGSATGGGVLSDSAAAHARLLMDEAQTPAQKQHVFDILKQDMRNRSRELAEQQTSLRASIKGGGSQGEHDSHSQRGGQQSGGAAIPPGAVYVGTSQGRPIYKVNGRNWTP